MGWSRIDELDRKGSPFYDSFCNTARKKWRLQKQMKIPTQSLTFKISKLQLEEKKTAIQSMMFSIHLSWPMKISDFFFIYNSLSFLLTVPEEIYIGMTEHWIKTSQSVG